MKKMSWIVRLTLAAVFALTASVAFADGNAVLGAKKINFPDINDYTLYIDRSVPPLSTLLDCLTICGPQYAQGAIAAYFLDDDVAKDKIKDCIKTGGILISRSGIRVDKTAGNAKVLAGIKASRNSSEAKAMLLNETNRCGKLVGATFNETYETKSIEEVDLITGPNYILSVLRFQRAEQINGQTRLLARYETLSHIILNGEVFIVACSDSRKFADAKPTEEFALQFLKALSAANPD